MILFIFHLHFWRRRTMRETKTTTMTTTTQQTTMINDDYASDERQRELAQWMKTGNQNEWYKNMYLFVSSQHHEHTTNRFSDRRIVADHLLINAQALAPKSIVFVVERCLERFNLDFVWQTVVLSPFAGAGHFLASSHWQPMCTRQCVSQIERHT